MRKLLAACLFSLALVAGAYQQVSAQDKVVDKTKDAGAAVADKAGDVLDSPISRTIIEQTATKVLFPNSEASAQEFMGPFGLTEREFKLIREQLEPGSRMFLVKQGHHSVVCRLDLKGFDAELGVISGRTGEVERMHRLMAELGPDPGQWLPAFLASNAAA